MPLLLIAAQVYLTIIFSIYVWLRYVSDPFWFISICYQFSFHLVLDGCVPKNGLITTSWQTISEKVKRNERPKDKLPLVALKVTNHKPLISFNVYIFMKRLN
ncbi:hypothetical protein BLOT_012906 [Blomia tropicalis]|nr:hypothetical protein BLOT_012906 [Blomia tropicalis]